MKIFMTSLLLIGTLTILSSCKDAPKGAEAVVETAKKVAPKASESKTLTVNSSSIVTWTGTKVNGAHTGTFNVTDGTINVKDGKIVGGKFSIDINSLNCTDLTAESGKGKLEGHLKSADFFDVAKFPTSTFEITAVGGGNVTGNLTLKGVTKSVSFPAILGVSSSGVNVNSGDFTINRTDFGMKYGSASFFDDLKDKAINDKVGLKIILTAS